MISATSPLFSYKLGFDKAETGMSGVTPKYDGNISYMKWKNSGNTYKAYSYSYDSNKQLSSANYLSKTGSTWSASNGYAEKNITYDTNGNILSLNRTNSTGDNLHTISYNYSLANNGNAVSGITLNNTTVSGYQYDVAGNLTYDPQRGATIEYNILNLPQRIIGNSGEVSYIYTSAGEKLATKVGSSLTYYRGPFVYTDNVLEYIAHPEGLVRKASGSYVYYYTKADHTGSTRLLCHASGDQMVVDQTTGYYPYGLSFQNENLNLNRHLYSGKELQDQTINGKMLGLYDFGSRNYDPILGRWFNVDPALQFTNPYLYCANSPMMYQDPNGEYVHIAIGALVGLIVNAIANIGNENVRGFGEWMAVVGAGAIAGAAIAASGGTSGALIGAGAGGGALTSGTNNLAAQTGKNFSGDLNWGQAGKSALIGGVAGAASSGAGVWAANSNMLVNGVNSPLLRSAVASPIAASAGHVAGGTTANLFAGQNFADAFGNSFKGIEKSALMGLGMGAGSTIVSSYANGINPFNGRNLSIPTDLLSTLNRIDNGEKYPHVRDGSTYQNREMKLPARSEGYYKEYVHPTQNIKGPGVMRVIRGQNGETWFTPDHYKTFIKITK